MYSTRTFPFILLFTLVFLIGCSGGGDSPIMPSGDETPAMTGQPPVADRSNEGEGYTSSHHLWGFYAIEVSEDHREAVVIPLREVAQHFNVLFYLESSPCTDCVKILNKSFPGGGVIDFGIQVRHPFPGQLYFTGFDVRGIAIFNAQGIFPEYNLKYSIRETGDGEIVNPDGFTHLYHVGTVGSGPNGMQGYIKGSMATPKNPTGTLNAYKNYYSSENRHFFNAGDAKEVHYMIAPPKGAFIFGYAVDANWAPPQTKPPEQIPEHFGLNANSPEAYQVSVTVGEGLTDLGGSAYVDIWVYDWQGFATIESVKLEAPDLFTGLVDASFDSMAGDYVVYVATITNDLAAAEGDYDMLIAVEDTENASAPDHLDLTAYQIVTVHVGQGIPNQAPVAVAEADKVEVMVDEEIQFDGSDSYDPDGTIEDYEWDFDEGGGFEGGLGDSPVKSYSAEGDYYVDLRVTDNLGATGTLVEKIHIIVGEDPCEGHNPIAGAFVNKDNPNVGEEVQFTDDSDDPDGYLDIVKFRWDWEADGEYDDGNKNPFHTFTEGGVTLVQHKVIDTINCWDELDEPMEICVNGPPVVNAEADKYIIEIGETIIFTSLAEDDDGCGDLSEYEWDLDGDGEYDSDKLGPVVSEVYYDPGTVFVQHRVTDVKGLSAELETPLMITVNEPGDVVIHLSEEEAMNPVGASYEFYNRWGSVGGTSVINYLDFDGPWDFSTLFANTAFYQDIVDKNDSSVSGKNSNWPSVQYYVRQEGPNSLDGSPSISYGAMKRDYDNPPDDGSQYTYGAFDGVTDAVLQFIPYNILYWPLDKFTNQYDSYETYIPSLGVSLDTEVWAQALGQGSVIIMWGEPPVPTAFQCLLLKVRQKDSITEPLPQVIADVVSYRWIADDGTEIAAITSLNSPLFTNWNTLTGIIEGNGNMRWLESYDLGG